MKVYITGKITGQAYDKAAAKFSAAEAQLTAAGYEVINPLRCGQPSGTPREFTAAVNILQLLGADAIYLLDDWTDSEASLIEKNIADRTGKAIIYEARPEFDDIKQAIFSVTGVTFQQIVGRSRILKVVYARELFAHFARETGATLPAIGQAMSHNHTTVFYYLKRYGEDYKYTKDFIRIADAVSEAVDTLTQERAEASE